MTFVLEKESLKAGPGHVHEK